MKQEVRVLVVAELIDKIALILVGRKRVKEVDLLGLFRFVQTDRSDGSQPERLPRQGFVVENLSHDHSAARGLFPHYRDKLVQQQVLRRGSLHEPLRNESVNG